MLDIKTFRSYQYDDTKCRLCGEESEDITLIINNCEKVRNTYPCMQIKDYMELIIEECNDIVDRLITFSNNVERIEASHE